jgi:hypothetical protein
MGIKSLSFTALYSPCLFFAALRQDCSTRCDKTKTMKEKLRQELLAMREDDLRVRREVLQGASSLAAYHPRMEELHRRNASRLKEIIAEYGWPERTLVGEDAAIAAWFIAEPAISDPEFQRRALELQCEARDKGEISAIGPAFLEDRICELEGRPQIYGTQFEPDEHGLPQSYWIADPEHVNERRAAIGLNTIEERTRELQAEQQPEYDPIKRAQYQRGYQEWLRKVGWRK